MLKSSFKDVFTILRKILTRSSLFEAEAVWGIAVPHHNNPRHQGEVKERKRGGL